MQTFNTQPEIRNGFHISAKRKRLWQIEIELLQDLLEVCQRNNLRIWVEGGTLLGAVRHKGYIPWDDDIDTIMPREDYNKLVKIADKEFKHPHFLQTAYSDTHYFRGHAQLRNSNTTGALPGEIFRDFNQGIFIDIFPLDDTPKSERDFCKLVKKVNIMRNTLANYHLPLDMICHRDIPFAFLRDWRNRYRIKRAGGFREYFQQFEELFTDKRDELSPNYTMLSSFLYNFIPKHLFNETIYLDFEHIKVPAIKDYDAYLKIEYGDYMTPVQAPSFHGSLYIETERPYTEVLKEVRKINSPFNRWKRKLFKQSEPAILRELLSL